MNIQEFSTLIRSLGDNLRVPVSSDLSPNFELITGKGLKIELEWFNINTLMVSCSQNCAGKDDSHFLWSILEANLIAEQEPVITNAGSYTDSAVMSWMKIDLSNFDINSSSSHLQRFINHVETLSQWINDYKLTSANIQNGKNYNTVNNIK